MPIATSVFKNVAIKKQSALGTKAPAGASGSAKYQRRTSSTIDLGKASFQSNEILTSQQRRDMRHGVKSVAGSLNQELSVGGHQLQLEAVLRAAAANVVTSTKTTVAATAGAAGSGLLTLADSANGWLTGGYKVGDVVDVSGFTTTGTANNKRFVVKSVAAGSLVLKALNGSDGATKTAGDSVTVVQAGKKIAIPVSGHTRDYFTVEHWHSDVAQSEVYTDCVFTGFNLNVPPNGMATIEFPVMGLNGETGTAEYFTSPAAESGGAILAGLNGALLVDGDEIADITSITLSVNGNYSAPGGVIGKNTDPDIFPGVIDTTGQITVLFKDAAMRDRFRNETETSIAVVLVADTSASPAFISFVLPRVKFSSAGKDDGQQGLTLTMPFTALEKVNGGAGQNALQTSLSIQDSAFA